MSSDTKPTNKEKQRIQKSHDVEHAVATDGFFLRQVSSDDHWA